MSIKGVAGTILGVYRVTALSGLTTSLAAGDTIFSMCWQQQNVRAALLQLSVKAQVVTPFTAAQEVAFFANMARAFTAVDTGGNTLAPGATQKLVSANNGNSLIADIRIASTSTLTAGTRTLDGSGFMNGIGAQLLAAASAAAPTVIADYQPLPHRYPQIFVQNEGIVVRNAVAMGAGGAVRFAVDVEWAEFLPA